MLYSIDPRTLSYKKILEGNFRLLFTEALSFIFKKLSVSGLETLLVHVSLVCYPPPVSFALMRYFLCFLFLWPIA